MSGSGIERLCPHGRYRDGPVRLRPLESGLADRERQSHELPQWAFGSGPGFGETLLLLVVYQIQCFQDRWCPSSGGLLQVGQFTAINPDEGARGARINDRPSRTVIRMNLHAVVTAGAGQLTREFGGVSRPGGEFGPAELSAAGFHDLTKLGARK